MNGAVVLVVTVLLVTVAVPLLLVRVSRAGIFRRPPILGWEDHLYRIGVSTD